jgi:hypothetical protein
LHFPLSDVSLQKLKRAMPSEHLVKKHPQNENSNHNLIKEDSASHLQKQTKLSKLQQQPHQQQQQQTQSQQSIIQNNSTIKQHHVNVRPNHNNKRRKHNDSISESILIKEKLLPSSSFTSVGKNNNVLIPRNNHNILNSIDLKGTDGAAIKKLMNNNNGDLNGNGNGEGFNDDDDDDERDGYMDDNSDSETITGDESIFDPDLEEDLDDEDDEDEDEEEEEDENDSESDLIDEEEVVIERRKSYNHSNKKKIARLLN